MIIDLLAQHVALILPNEPRPRIYAVLPFARERSVNVSEPESLELMVSNLKPEESYSFRVVAYNDVGPGESSAPLRITTKPDRKAAYLLSSVFYVFDCINLD